MSTVDIDRDAARDAAQAELGKAIYPKPTAMDLLLDWFDDLLYRLTAGAADVPGGWLTVSVLALLVVIAVVVAVRVARRAVRSGRSGAAPLFDDRTLGAAEHRARAERHAAEQDWAPAIRHRLRAVARQLEENGVVDPVPGRTATELAGTAGRALPALAAELALAATNFNDVTYGERPGSAEQYRSIADLDTRLGTASATTAGPGAPTTARPWAEVR